MSITEADVRQQLTAGSDDEFEFDCKGVCSIGADRIHEGTVRIEHFNVVPDRRGEGLGSLLFETLCDVLRERGIFDVETNVGCAGHPRLYTSINELDAYKAEQDSEYDDPTYRFFERYYPKSIEYVDTFQFGVCVRSHHSIA
jgi:GNAT superfamily N-acetyltransferase